MWLGKARGTRKIPQNLDISQNKYELFFRVKMDPSVKTSIEKRLIESGEKERLKVLINNQIIQCCRMNFFTLNKGMIRSLEIEIRL